MEYYYFVIIVIIVLKILFWTFYFYVRAQRLRQTQTTHRFIIVGARPVARGRGHPYNDRSAIIDHAEPVSATGPPPYAEVVKDGSYPLPPSYDQVMTAPAANATAAMPPNTAPFQNSMLSGGASAVPAFSHAPSLSGGNGTMSGDSPATGPITSCPTEYLQSFAGQVASGTSVSIGQNRSVPQQ